MEYDDGRGKARHFQISQKKFLLENLRLGIQVRDLTVQESCIYSTGYTQLEIIDYIGKSMRNSGIFFL